MSRRTRVRFAPSPTGPMHIGGLRTALFNYLFAARSQGDFILRIEDTDLTRYVEDAEEYIIESLRWCGLQYSEGPDIGGQHEPYRQSERKHFYKKFAEQLINNGHAYYGFDSQQELENLRKEDEKAGKTFQYDAATRSELKNSLSLPETETIRLMETGTPYVVRFKMPEQEEVKIRDMIRGDVSFSTSLLDDKVLFKSDGLPTYHLANVVDDYLMEITHVIRGEEWLPSLPLHILLYRALGWENNMPEFAHLPLILKPGGQGKLSKRDGDKMGFPVFPLQWKDPASGEISQGYRESGYFPEAVVNMLALLGWNPGDEQELFTLQQLTDVFSIERVGKSGAHFDPDKAKWYNQQYLKNKDYKDLEAKFIEILQKRHISIQPKYVKKVTGLVKERMVFPQDFWDHASYFFEAPTTYDLQMKKKVWKDDTPKILTDIKEVIEEAGNFNSSVLEEAVRAYIEKHKLGFGKVAMPLRLLIVGSGKGPHLFDILEMIGKEETVKRINAGLQAMG